MRARYALAAHRQGDADMAEQGKFWAADTFHSGLSRAAQNALDESPQTINIQALIWKAFGPLR